VRLARISVFTSKTAATIELCRMKSRKIIVVALPLLFALLSVLPVYADSILISQTGPGTGAWGIDAVESNAVSWSEISAHPSVTVSANLIGDFSGTAYLTSRIGQGTTLADVIETSLFTVASANTHVWIDLFTDVHLGPGTFYLVLGSPAINGGGWSNTFAPILTTAPGITYNGSYASVNGLNNLAFFPASTFTNAGDIAVQPFQFQVVAELPRSVPEPNSFLLLSFGLLALLAVRHRHAR
jgi:hypothetical protein